MHSISSLFKAKIILVEIPKQPMFCFGAGVVQADKMAMENTTVVCSNDHHMIQTFRKYSIDHLKKDVAKTSSRH